jgi:hypothetical protein
MSLLRYKQKMLPYGNPMGGGGDGGGGGKGGVPIVPVLITVVAVVATVYAGPAVGAAIVESIGGAGAAAELGATGVAAVGGAAISGSTSAVNAAVQGKNIEGVLQAGAIGAGAGAAGGAVGAEVSEAVTGATGGSVAIPSDAGPTLGANAPGAIAGGAAGGATSGFTRAELSGSNLNQALKQGEIGGATGAITSAIGQGVQAGGGSTDDARLAAALSGPFVAQNVSNLFAPQTSAGTTGGGDAGGPTSQLVGTAPTTGQPAPGSAALGQALRIGDPGAPVESPGGGESSRQPVWNLASLRVKDETGSSA